MMLDIQWCIWNTTFACGNFLTGVFYLHFVFQMFGCSACHEDNLDLMRHDLLMLFTYLQLCVSGMRQKVFHFEVSWRGPK